MTVADRVRTETPTEPSAPSREPSLQPPTLPLRAGLWVASRALRSMGRVRYVLADSLGTAVYVASPQGRRRCAANHMRADPSLDAAQAKRRALRSYREFMRTSFDFVWEYAMSPERLTADLSSATEAGRRPAQCSRARVWPRER